MIGPEPRDDRRPVVLVGLMGAGKTTIGRRLARLMDRGFVDSDEEISRESAMSVADIFAAWGEPAFRDLERRVIARLLAAGPQVVAIGGGAFLDPATRDRIRAQAVSVWLKADLDVLVRRTRGRSGRPLLDRHDPEAALAALLAARYPVYAEADITVLTGDDSKDATAARVLAALEAHRAAATPDGCVRADAVR